MTIDTAEILADILGYIPKIIAAIVIFCLSWVASNWAARWSERLLEKYLEQSEVAKPLERLLRSMILVLGTIAALDQVDFDVSAFLAGMGIVGLTIGFALQNITENFVSGILILTRRPFEIGHAVSVADYSGMIVDVRMRDTTIRTWDGVDVILPNTTILNAPITNYSAASRRRRTIEVGIARDEDVATAQTVFAQALGNVPGILDDPEPTAYASDYGDSTITLALRFWFEPKGASLLDVHARAIAAVQQAAADHEIDLPYPTQMINLATPYSS